MEESVLTRCDLHEYFQSGRENKTKKFKQETMKFSKEPAKSSIFMAEKKKENTRIFYPKKDR